jgi:ribosomal protein S18 acetylase RimI-like enzyme
MDLEPLLRFWRAQDDLFAAVEPRWWGAVVSDPRFPAIQEPNYARVETRRPVRLREVERDLLPAMRRSGSRRSHVVIFHPQDQTDLVVEASTRGERITWDLVMEHPGRAGAGQGPGAAGANDGAKDREGPAVDPAAPGDAFWAAHRASLRWFDIIEPDVIDQLEAMEREVMIPGGRRWFGAPGGEGIAALAALMVLEGVGFVDHVVTLPPARRRGLATALTRRAVTEAVAAGAERVYLLAEPGGVAAAMYERLGFAPVTQIASWISELGEPSSG